MKMEQTQRFETSAYKIQTSGNHPEENIQHTEYGENLKSKAIYIANLSRNSYSPSVKHGLL